MDREDYDERVGRGMTFSEGVCFGEIGPEVACTRHYEQRFAERVTRKSRRWEWFAQRAYEAGKRLEDIRNGAFRYYIESRESAYGGEARIYAGCVYWFVGSVAVTVYQVPRQFRGNSL